MSLFLARKIGSATEGKLQECITVLEGIHADGRPSPNTSQPFNCRVWAHGAMIALGGHGFVTLDPTVEGIMVELEKDAGALKPRVEGGMELARVEN